MSSKTQLVLVTGLSSFVGSHIVLRILQDGYRVRGTVRTSEEVREQTARNRAKYPNLEVVQVSDISTDDISSVFEYVDAVIHVASPTPSSSGLSAKQFHNIAVDGTLNVLSNAAKRGIRRVVITSSLTTTIPSLEGLSNWGGLELSNRSWAPISPMDIVSSDDSNTSYNYNISKILAEKAAWGFAKEHPELDIITVHPPFVYGPYASDLYPASESNIGSNFFLYQLVQHEPGSLFPMQIFPGYCDARDVARAHVAALSIPTFLPGAPPEDRRILIWSGNMTYGDVINLLWKERPGLRDRLFSADDALKLPERLPKVDTTLAKNLLGLKEEEYIPWKQTVLDTFDSFTDM